MRGHVLHGWPFKVILWTFRLFSLFVVSKSMRVEVCHSVLSVMFSYFKVSAKNSQQHPCQLKVGTWKTSKKHWHNINPKRQIWKRRNILLTFCFWTNDIKDIRNNSVSNNLSRDVNKLGGEEAGNWIDCLMNSKWGINYFSFCLIALLSL